MLECLLNNGNVQSGRFFGLPRHAKVKGSAWSSGSVNYLLEGNASITEEGSLIISDNISALSMTFSDGLNLDASEDWYLELEIKGSFSGSSNNVFVCGAWPSEVYFQIQYYRNAIYTYFAGPYRIGPTVHLLSIPQSNHIVWQSRSGMHEIWVNGSLNHTLDRRSVSLKIPVGDRLELPMRKDGNFNGQYLQVNLVKGQLRYP